MVNRKIIFYDGDCGFCNRSIQFILNNEKRHELHFCALQNEVTKAFFEWKKEPKPDLSTLIYFDGERFFTRSTAVLKAAKFLRFPKNLTRIAWIVPAFIRDYFYQQVAKRRHTLVNPSCLVPNSEQKARFLNEKWW